MKSELEERKKEIIDYLNEDSIVHAKVALDRPLKECGFNAFPDNELTR